MENYYEVCIVDHNGESVHDTAWSLDEAMLLADNLKTLHPDCEVCVYEYRYAGVVYNTEEEYPQEEGE